jgi:hypothetical protein
LSKLSEKIKKVTRFASTPIGFGSATTAKEPTMVLVGLAKDAKEAADLAKRGADAVVVSNTRPDAAKDVPGTIAGAVIAGKQDDEAKAYREGGFDFVVFDPNQASATALLDDQIGYVLTLPRDIDEQDMRALESFQLEAIDVGTIDGGLTVRRQIEFRRIFALTRKPLWARVKGDLSVLELQALRDTNIIVVAAEKAEDVEKLRTTIDALPPRVRRRDADERPTPLVPRTVSVEDDDDEDEDDD